MKSYIRNFLSEEHILALASWSSEEAYICNCFYKYTELNNKVKQKKQSVISGLIIASDHNTRHGREMLQQSRVAIAIHKNIRAVPEIQGVQLQGLAYPRPVAGGLPQNHNMKFAIDWDQLEAEYVQAFPEALAMPALPLWFIVIEWLKYTDNRIAFGHKEVWQVEHDSIG